MNTCPKCGGALSASYITIPTIKVYNGKGETVYLDRTADKCQACGNRLSSRI